MVECPECQGYGEHVVLGDSYWDRNIEAWVPNEYTIPCSLCNGMGEVFPDVAEWYCTAGGPPPYGDEDIVIYDTFLDQEERLLAE